MNINILFLFKYDQFIGNLRYVPGTKYGAFHVLGLIGVKMDLKIF
jgi:predicted tellurium resistance membrane protein TerC